MDVERIWMIQDGFQWVVFAELRWVFGLSQKSWNLEEFQITTFLRSIYALYTNLFLSCIYS